MTLKPLDRLPPSADAIAEEAAEAELTLPEDRVVSWFFLGRSRGVLLLLGVLGLVAFTMPWVELVEPYEESISGYLLARRGSGWLWGGAAAWLVLVPLVLTRRTVRKMRGVRAIVTVFAAMTAVEVAMLAALPPRGSPLVRYEYEWGLGLYASAVVSALGIAFGLRFGGPLPRETPRPPPPGTRDERAPPGVALH